MKAKAAVTEDDVRHVAALARIGLTPERVPALVSELNGILSHLNVIARVDTSDVDPVLGVGAGGTRLRADEGDPYPMSRERDAIAPDWRGGFFVVPRLATHASGAVPEDASIGEGAA